MVKKFYNLLSLEEVERFSLVQPTDSDFQSYIEQNWPSFGSFPATPRTSSLRWGCVSKTEGTPNEINILASIVETAESPVSPILG